MPVEYRVLIQKARRKTTIGFQVMPDGVVRVSIPQHYPADHVPTLLARKERWINKRLQLVQQHAALTASRQYQNGEHFYVLGQAYALQRIRSPAHADNILVRCTTAALEVYVGDLADATESVIQTAIKTRLTAWYQDTAKDLLTQRTWYFAQPLKCMPKSIQVKSYKSRWGCCSRNHEISYNWLIIMAPQCIVDYLIVHELCHIQHHHHGASFWQAVEQVMPDYQAARTWLREQGHRLLV